ncbi:MAG TPA: DUF4932 domain-containing protein [Ignavibacteriaceae bacterium]|nr:DUF4932 domain-containing protein [Ignavibacteriaceae bacterium]
MISLYRKIVIILVLISPIVKGTETKLNISIDPRIELLSVVQYLSGYSEYGLITRFNFTYKDDIIKYFTKYIELKAVKLFSEMSQQGFAFDAPPTAMLFLSNPPEFKTEIAFTQYIIKRAGGEKELTKFIEALRIFSIETNFMRFYNEHKPFYKKIVQNIKNKIGNNDYINEIETYYGMVQNSYNIIAAPLFHQGGFGPRIERKNNKFDIYSIGGPDSINDSLPGFGSSENLRYLIWHEFSHSFINPLTEQHADEIKKVSSLFEPINDRMSKQGYSSWDVCVKEHLIRAITVRLSYIYSGNKEGDKALYDEKAKGFVYLPDICKNLSRYENNRDLYPTFADFYPEIIKLFTLLTKTKHGEDYYYVPFKGTINSAFSAGHPIKFIIPTNETDKDTQNKIKEYVEAIQKKIFPKADLITDIDALKENLSNYSLAVYGTPSGNLWLKKYIGLLPVKIETDKIIADSVYLGNDLRYITAWPNPQDSNIGIVIYTAQKADNVIGINSLFAGPTDFVIARGDKKIKSANYNKNEKWKY